MEKLRLTPQQLKVVLLAGGVLIVLAAIWLALNAAASGNNPGTDSNSETCMPKTCSSLGYNCGSFSDGCSETMSRCGTCKAPQTCIKNHCKAHPLYCIGEINIIFRLKVHFVQFRACREAQA